MINNVVLMGRLVATPELRNTQTGLAVTSFSLAVERSYARQGEQRQTDFINCVAWRNTAEFISRYFQKGSMIAVTGSIQTRNYEDKTVISAQQLRFLLTRQASAAQRQKQAQATTITTRAIRLLRSLPLLHSQPVPTVTLRRFQEMTICRSEQMSPEFYKEVFCNGL